MTDSQPARQAAGRTGRLPPGHVGLTLLACALVAAACALAGARLTGGFEQWTFEARRRQEAAAGRLDFPAMPVVDSSGRVLQLPAGGTGRVMLVNFIYTRCMTVCQALGIEFQQAQQRIRSAGSGIRLLSVSVDPVHDTPAALAGYARLHRADSQVWQVAAPQSQAEDRRARRALGVIAIDDGMGGFVHNGDVHVVDAHGRVAGIFDTADWAQALALARRLEAAAP